MTYDVELREMQPQQTASIRDKVAQSEVDQAMTTLLAQASNYLERQGMEAAGPPFIRYHTPRKVEEIEVDVEVGYPVEQPVQSEGNVIPGKLLGGPAAVARFVGPYEEIDEAYYALEQWIENSDYEAAGEPWEMHSKGLQTAENADTWTVEVVWPLQKPSRQRP